MISQLTFRVLRVVCIASLLGMGAAAQATPVDLFFNGSVPSNDGNFYGLSSQSVTDFLNAGGQNIANAPTMFITDPMGTKVQVLTPDAGGIPGGQGGPDFVANPSFANNDWQITPQQTFQDLWIVFRGHSFLDANGINNRAGGYLPQNVGLNIDPMSTTDIWRLVTVPGMMGNPDTFYLALYLGANPAVGTTISQRIDYRVRQALLMDPASGNHIVPEYLIGYITAPLPEAGTAWLLGGGLLLFASRRARR